MWYARDLQYICGQPMNAAVSQLSDVLYMCDFQRNTTEHCRYSTSESLNVQQLAGNEF